MKLFITIPLALLISFASVTTVSAETSVVTNPVFEENIQEDTESIITNPMDNNYLEKKIDSPIIKYTEAELNLLARVIEAEAKGESYAGKKAVGDVIVNRVLDSRFPNTITNVVYAKGQFSTVANGSINNKPSEDSINAAKEVLYRDYDRTNGATFFWAHYVPRGNWVWTRTIVAQIGNHYFGK